jgi:CHAD domain-containing protein
MERLALAAHALEQRDPRAVSAVRLELWRLREVVPVLQLPPAAARKLDTRLRELTRRLGKLRTLDAFLTLTDDVLAADARVRQVSIRMKNDLRRQRAELGLDRRRRKTLDRLHRVSKKLDALLEFFGTARESPASVRATRWAVKARVSRRAAMLKQALDAAGAVYLPGRLRGVRGAIRKLRFGVELLHDVAGAPAPADLQPVERAQEALDLLRDTEAFIVPLRALQSGLPASDPKAWQDLDAAVRLCENRCRRLHARYVRERSALVALCDRLGARVIDAAKSKAS